MKPIRLSLLAALIMALCSQVSAQFRMPELPPSELYTISCGNIQMKIDAARGARITSFTFDGQEVISQLDRPNMYGSTFWTSPQKEWSWPPVFEHDLMAYTVDGSGNEYVMTSQLSQKFPVRIRKKFAADPGDRCIVVTYTIINESDKERKVAPWEITRVPAQGDIFFDAPLNSITPAGLMPFVKKNGLAWYTIDHDETQNRKINADGKGWLCYRNDGLLLTKRFDDLTSSQPAPDEAEIQVYVHKGNVYVELESQGEYKTLKPGESLDWTVRWYLEKDEN